MLYSCQEYKMISDLKEMRTKLSNDYWNYKLGFCVNMSKCEKELERTKFYGLINFLSSLQIGHGTIYLFYLI